MEKLHLQQISEIVKAGLIAKRDYFMGEHYEITDLDNIRVMQLGASFIVKDSNQHVIFILNCIFDLETEELMNIVIGDYNVPLHYDVKEDKLVMLESEQLGNKIVKLFDTHFAKDE